MANGGVIDGGAASWGMTCGGAGHGGVTGGGAASGGVTGGGAASGDVPGRTLLPVVDEHRHVARDGQLEPHHVLRLHPVLRGLPLEAPSGAGRTRLTMSA